MKGLMLHAGSVETDLEGLGRYPAPMPVGRWFPLAHETFANQVVNTIDAYGIEISDMKFGVKPDGSRFFGMLSLRQSPTEIANGYDVMVGLRNSYDQSEAAKLAVGSHVFVCDNMAFSAEIVVSRKNTRFISRDLSGLVSKSVSRLTESRTEQANRIGTYKDFELSNLLAHDLIVQFIDSRVIGTSQVTEVLKQWRTPDHEEFSKRNAWSLFNAVTNELKELAMPALVDRTQRLHGVLDAYVAGHKKDAIEVYAN